MPANTVESYAVQDITQVNFDSQYGTRKMVYTWREDNPAIRYGGENSSKACVPVAGTGSGVQGVYGTGTYITQLESGEIRMNNNYAVENFFDFWYSSKADADVLNNDDNDWKQFNDYDANNNAVPNSNTKSIRASIKEGMANRLIDGATYKIKMTLLHLDPMSDWIEDKTFDINITKVMPTAMPSEFGVRSLQFNDGVWPFYLRPYAGVEYGETTTDSPWKISWNDGDGQAPAEHNYRWGVDVRPYDFKELFRGLILPEENKIDRDYYFVFEESGNFGAADMDGSEASDEQYKDVDAITVYTEDVDGGCYRLPKIHWSHVGEKKNVKAGYIYRGISAKFDETGTKFLAPEDEQTGLPIENQDYAITPIPVMIGSKRLLASFNCAFDAAVTMTADTKENTFEHNQDISVKATDAKFKLKNKLWFDSGYSQAYFNNQFPATWTDTEGGVGTLAGLIADSYFWVDMTSLKCNVTSPVGYNYRDYYYEPYFTKGDGTKANSFKEIADICMKPHGNSPGLGDLKPHVEGTFTFDIYDIWFHSRTVTVNFKIPGTFDASGLRYTVIPGTSTVSVSASSTALSGCVSIPEVAINEGIPYSVVAIDKVAFYDCTDLTSLTIAKSVKTIGYGAFKGCEALTRLIAIGDEPIVMTNGQDVFAGINFDLCELHVPVDSKSEYEEAEGWRLFSTIVEDIINVDSIISDDGMTCNFNYSITDNNEISLLGVNGDVTVTAGAFTIPSGVTKDGKEYVVTSIAPNAFEDCIDMTSLTIPESITSIGDHAFAGCTGLKEIFCFSSVPIDLSTMLARGLMRTASGTVPTQLEGIDFENCILYVPFGTSRLYREAEGWCLFRNIHEQPDGELSLGDVNCDSEVNNLDVNLIGSHVAGEFPSSFVWDAADMNHDGEVDIVDVTALIQMLLDRKP